jgi:SagB-type dehydrogenase family enzyme
LGRNTVRTLLAPSVVGALVVTTVLASCSGPGQAGTPPDAESVIPLPAPSLPVRQEIIDMFEGRHSTREFPPEPVLLQEASSLLWAGYGFRRDGGRVVPSAGAIYPMTLYLVAGDVTGLDAGVYAYDPAGPQLALRRGGDVRDALMSASLDQAWVGAAPMSIVVAGAPDRLRHRYGKRSERYAMMEAGHIGQNLALAVQPLGLGMVTVGAFDDEAVSRVVSLPRNEQPYYVLPVGRPR